MKYIIREQIPCYVNFYREVEADNEEQALDKDRQGDNRYLGHSVGDSVGFLDSTAHGVVDSLPENFCSSDRSRVLVEVSGGVAEVSSEGNVETLLVDYDNGDELPGEWQNVGRYQE